ncbi:alpha/beta fold hydrolase [Aeromicrobium tamlense]|uniref:Alpha/beta fold hydrolase n=1 Tax=Aeromicrobium tamlense TaxID=375541 RepID=A0A8I0KKA9_9ACTN|nr:MULTISPECIES: alpha/beta fold hydrolase [Aeromicrobium]MBD1268658.1 alpha/beta fold hydrolase [Aeromicrobium tamlense]NYI37435.1 pimeloyl-ACP methyl ester carboxylesterase [Aeromicrobium tamlense]
MVRPPERGAVDDVDYVVVHGYRRAYRMRGSGPPLLLLHGMACDSSTWFPVMDLLAEHFTVIAPDLLGHGESDKPNADYSLGGFANGMRDLLTILGIDKVTVAGHSFGGGVAMQFAYQFPERTERVVLVSSGGLGPEVTPLIRALTLPGVGLGMRLATLKPWRGVASGALRALSRVPAARDLDEVAAIYERLADPATTLAIRRLTRTVLDMNGQFVTMADRAYLTRLMPLLVVWGRDDRVIPVAHAQRLPLLENSHVHVFEDSGHFPHKDHPEEFARLVVDFCRIQAPAQYHRGKWRALLRRGDQAGLASVSLSDAGSESPSAVS